ncbi:MAG: sigma-70 family RNA polymerase sigma factor [Candidatus Eremiobacteraeota bacterium]|nr:sigma-70 family RNA polymerase sigma factor [Candidatus Eremiobacteraeota bacterium]
MSQPRSPREELFEAHRYLCGRGARKFLRRGLERSDLEQVAAIGLLKASRRYDPATKTPFEAFAWLMIVGELMHHVRDLEHAVRVPRCVRALERRYLSVSELLTQRLEREPRDAEVAALLNVPPETAAELRRVQNTRVHEHIEEAHGRALCDDPVDRILAERALAVIAPGARTVVLGIYALGLSRNEIARRAGMSAREVTRTHDAALAQMRGALSC